MLLKNLAITVDQRSWGRRKVPLTLSTAPAVHQMDVAKALLMLGTLTLPSLISPASPARFWAWLRYFLAVARNDDLRITRDFAELDPHQKGILSDDLGVAISTQWLFDRFGGFANIVDGRRFMVQFPHLLQKTITRKPTAKVGPSKAPDYVILDKAGKWHVLECKGTQSGPGFRDAFLKDAVAQKHVILMKGRIRGERLAAGFAISHEHQHRDSSLRIIDPAVDPVLTLGPSRAGEMSSKANRLTVARALSMVGLSDAGVELSLPPDVLEAPDFLEPLERRHARQPTADRSARATVQLRERELPSFQFNHRQYEGRTALIELPELGSSGPFNAIMIRQGVDHDLLDELSKAPSVFADSLSEEIDARLSNSSIEMETGDSRTTLTYGNVLFAEVILKRL